MTAPPPPTLVDGRELAGDALVRDLERRFRTDVAAVRLGEETFDILKPANADDLITEADYVKDERLPYWADIWPSSIVLGTVMLGRGPLPGRTRALELGCGSGVVTTAAMRAGFDVTATDYYDDALRFTRANAWRALGREPATRMVDWRHFPRDLGVFDLVLASDVLYEHAYATLVADAIRATLAADGVALVADPGRIAAGEFLDYAKGIGFRIAQTVHPFEEGKIKQQITVYELRPDL